MDKGKIAEGVRLLLEGIGEDPDRPGLTKTPQRVAEMYGEIFSGIGADLVSEVVVMPGDFHQELVLVRDIPFYSTCEHHLLPFHGKAHVAYIPSKEGSITGLSKLARVVETASKRLQLQERLTSQIADALEEALEPLAVLVLIEAEHLCMSMRGVQKPGTLTVTSVVRGVFMKNDASRAEVLSLIKGHTS